uniref:Uncharacterized protein n=1 Tax=Anguilla anguilla TaxID=7936 RepID=A0A0E9STI6_ANGAN
MANLGIWMDFIGGVGNRMKYSLENNLASIRLFRLNLSTYFVCVYWAN